MPFVFTLAGGACHIQTRSRWLSLTSSQARAPVSTAPLSVALLSLALAACDPERVPPLGDEEGEGPDSPNQDDSDSDAPAGDGDGARPVVDTPWCRALAVLRERCQSCHGEDRLTGAPMSLTSYEELTRPAVTEPDRKVYELVGTRIHDGEDPMPPQGVLGDDELAVLDAWLNAGHPAGTDPKCEGLQVDAGTLPIPQEEPWPEDCEIVYTVLAHDPADPTKPFRIPAGQEVQLPLKIDPLPWAGESVQALAFRPRIDNLKVLHHWNLLEGDGTQEGGTIIWGSAPGSQGSGTLPDDVGFHLPQGPINLEMHYYNVGGTEDEFDQSGLEICATRTFRKHTAAITKHFNAFPYLLPNQRGESTEVCRVLTTTDEDIHVIGIIPHMHKLGVHAFLSVTSGLDERVVLDSPYSFDDQRVHPMNDVIIKNGDVVKTRCTWENTTNEYVDYGLSSDKEMCANFAIYWPMDGFFCLGI